MVSVHTDNRQTVEIYNRNVEAENWYLMGGFQYSIQRMPIDVDRAAEIIDSYRVIPIEIVSFS